MHAAGVRSTIMLPRIHAQCTATGDGKVHVCVSASGKIFLVNRGDAQIRVQPMELFGFGVGVYAEIPTGAVVLTLTRVARSMHDS